MKTEQLQNDLSDALQDDFENGVKWLNKKAAEEFYTKYPEISKIITKIMDNEYTDS